jgi:hypothetical protein
VGDDPDVNPVKFVFDLNPDGHINAEGAKPAGYRWSWSGPALLHAAFPGRYTSYLGTNGKVTITGSGFPSTATTQWGMSTNRGQRYLGLNASTATINAVFDSLLNLPVGTYPGFVGNSTTIKSNATIKRK